MSCDFEAIDPNGITVRCHHDTWESHVADEHLEMRDQQAAVSATITQPVFIYQDRAHPRRHVYYRPFVLPEPYYRYYLRVVVEYHGHGDRKRGALVTAFAAANIRQGDVLIWSKYEAKSQGTSQN